MVRFYDVDSVRASGLCVLRITARLMLLALVATVRCCWFAIEQPMSSMMTHFPYLRHVEDTLTNLLGWYQCGLPGPHWHYMPQV